MSAIFTLLLVGACGLFIFVQVRGIIADIKEKKAKKAKVVKADESKEAETTEN